MTYKDDGRYMEKRVDPTDHILNDNDVGVDYLGHTVYAEALAETITNVKTPVTIGVFARWGSGKSFLVKHVCNILRRRQMQGEHAFHRDERFRWLKCLLWLLCPALLFVVCLFLSVIPMTPLCQVAFPVTTPSPTLDGNNTTKAPNSTQTFNCKQAMSLAGLVSSLSLAVLFFLMLCCLSRCSSSWLHNLKLLFIAAFSKLPVSSEERAIVGGDEEFCVLRRAKSENSNDTTTDGSTTPPKDVEANESKRKQSPIVKRYILVNFNAWAYEGSDNLWAGIATNISEAVEKEFGSITSRLFRLLDVETVSQEPESRHAIKSRLFFAEFGANPRLEILEGVLQSFGVLCRFEPYTTWKNRKGQRGQQPSGCEKWWVVEYCSKLQTQTACENIRKGEIKVQFTDPFGKASAQNPGVHEQNGSAYSRNSARQNENGVTQTDINMVQLNGQTQQNQRTGSNGNEETPMLDENHQNNRNEEKASEAYEPLWGCWELFKNFPKTRCHIPVLVWVISLILVLVVLIPIASYGTAVSQAIPIAASVFAWVPGVVAFLSSVCGVVWAMFHSQTSRITSALKGVKSDMESELGVMDKIKYEINVISKLVQCTRFSHAKEYKIVLAIDDLDRISQHKVKSVLQAVNILLSDRSSPFVCMIAVDPRIAVNCLESEMSETLLQANVNGHEYIKKIINLPFCLPDVGKKKQFIEGLISEADITTSVFKKFVSVTADPPSNRRTVVDGDEADEDSVDGVEYSDTRSLSRTSLDSSTMGAYSSGVPRPLGSHRVADGAPVPRSVAVTHKIRNLPAQGEPPVLAPQTTSIITRKSLPSDTDSLDERNTSQRWGIRNQDIFQPTPSTSNATMPQPALRMSDGDVRDSHTITAHVILKAKLQNKKAYKIQNVAGPTSPNSCYDTTDAAPVSRMSSWQEPNENSISSRANSIRTPRSSTSSYQASSVDIPSVPPEQTTNESKLGTKDFLYECKKCFHEDDILTTHLHSNPRNIKRIFNVLTLTAAMINCKYKVSQMQHYFRNARRLEEQQDDSGHAIGDFDEMDADARTKSLAQKIARWVVLTDQWPYRTSYILQVIEDADQRTSAGREGEDIPNHMSLHKIYERHVRAELGNTDLKNNRLLALDGDADTFYSYLKRLGAQHMSKGTAKSLLRYTINLDHSIRLTIAKQREEIDMMRESTIQAATEAPRQMIKVKQNRKRRRQQSGQSFQQSPIPGSKRSSYVFKTLVQQDSLTNRSPVPRSQQITTRVNDNKSPHNRRPAGDFLKMTNPIGKQQVSPNQFQNVGREYEDEERRSSFQPTDDHVKTSPEVDIYDPPGYLPNDLILGRLASA